MIGLELATLVKPKELNLYDFDEYKVNKDSVKRYFQIMDDLKLYSKVLQDFLRNLSEMDVDRRWNFKRTLDELGKFS